MSTDADLGSPPGDRSLPRLHGLSVLFHPRAINRSGSRGCTVPERVRMIVALDCACILVYIQRPSERQQGKSEGRGYECNH